MQKVHKSVCGTFNGAVSFFTSCTRLLYSIANFENQIFESSLQGRDGKDVSVGELTTRIRRLQPEHGHKHRRGEHSISQILFTSFHPIHPHLLLLCDSYSAGAAAVSEKGA